MADDIAINGGFSYEELLENKRRTQSTNNGFVGDAESSEQKRRSTLMSMMSTGEGGGMVDFHVEEDKPQHHSLYQTVTEESAAGITRRSSASSVDADSVGDGDRETKLESTNAASLLAELPPSVLEPVTVSMVRHPLKGSTIITTPPPSPTTLTTPPHLLTHIILTIPRNVPENVSEH